MNELVYSLYPCGKELSSLLEEAGFRVVSGSGTFDMDLLRACDALLPGKGVVTRELLEQAPALKIISKAGVGMERIDIDACTELGIWACNTPLTNYIAVAEHTLALMLAAAKKLYPISMKLHTAEPDWNGAVSYRPAVELAGKNLTLVGFGNIGRRVARLLENFDMVITVYDPYVPEDSVPAYVRLVRDLDEALKDADFVSVHAAGQKSTTHLIGAHEFSVMKPTAILINTTRGFVIDEEALIRALKEGQITGAGLDVFAEEPVTGSNELLVMDNVIATPHTAALTPESGIRTQRAVAENIISFFTGKRPPYACNEPKRKQPEILPLCDTR